ncbi:hypothetical protein HDU87_001188 [Geranomyces variabilis]|uniref:Uncharacterized protein n=1 Tax=Geranomyces variabilis TaxID=109894 RepID=A0AAD5TCJ3_9FUNG|nr:hypothetical protein HDU87_001188 [Geranomyces variabilis]
MAAPVLGYPTARQSGMTSKAKRIARGATESFPIDLAYSILLLVTGTTDYSGSLAIVDGEMLLDPADR